ncbi:class I SAM-dependent methyltransferase [Emticicia sp. BO119]|uniref:class I SAM-dependent methyltransferase n=1 Tax=Emticicia sp. BO119 TaxID=2757768 RepID=UPI0015F0EB1C|nr:class I SAM-dependent methyltransferase [Emticicia sp. BO119]MBA4853086.1 methyltransferase domain-containing protein [Emticicia sp. BO119]
MNADRLISVEIESFYTQTSEEARLQLGLGPLEFERNKDLIQRHLPVSKGVILDVGGGPGIYSEWLSGMGYTVYLIDPVPKHIKQATKRASGLKKPFKVILGEARQLNFADESVDVVILHGPLYHLQDKQARIKALQEAKRVVKKNGVILGFAINYAASTIAGLLNGLIHEPGFIEMCKQELLTGVHTPPKNMVGSLAEAYYHRPAQLIEEFKEAELTFINIYAVEGVVWLDKKYFESRADAKKKQALIDLLTITENDQALLALSPHMMIAGKKV